MDETDPRGALIAIGPLRFCEMSGRIRSDQAR